MSVADGVTWETCAVPGCRGARLGSEGQCVGHASSESLGQLLAPGPTGVDLDGRGVAFDAASLGRVLDAIPLVEGKRFVGSARFDGATFEHEVGFDEATFSGPASFAGASFAGDARFGGAVFGADVSFEGATFGQQAWFVGAAFRGPTTFFGATFSGSAWFQRTSFGAGARFDRGTFDQNVTFSGATFSSVSSFTAAHFRSLSVFDRATFAAASSWDDATFAVEGQGPPPGVEVPKPHAPPSGNGISLEALSRAPRHAPRAASPRRSRAEGSRLANVLLPLLVVAVLATAAFIILRPSGGPVAIDEGVGTTTLDPRSPAAQIDSSTLGPDSTIPPVTAPPTTLPPTTITPTTVRSLGDATAYAFQSRDKMGNPARFNPCADIRYIVNPAGAPLGWEVLLQQVMAELGRAMGVTFAGKGTTDERVTLIDEPAPSEGGEPRKRVERPSYQADRYPGVWAPILIAWDDVTPAPGAIAGFETSGFGGSDKRTNLDGTEVYVSGVVVVARTLDPSLLKGVLMHELGHIVGLGHTTDQYQIMAATRSEPQDTWGAGDLTGLAKVGRESKCATVPSPV